MRPGAELKTARLGSFREDSFLLQEGQEGLIVAFVLKQQGRWIFEGIGVLHKQELQGRR